MSHVVNNFTYTPGEDTDLARVRTTISDTDEDAALFDDAEIELFLAIEGDWRGAAAAAAESLAARYAQDFNFTSDDTTVKKGDRAKHYAQLAERLRGRSTGIGSSQTVRQDGWQANRGVNHAKVTSTQPTARDDF